MCFIASFKAGARVTPHVFGLTEKYFDGTFNNDFRGIS